jgi:hypothetical protein
LLAVLRTAFAAAIASGPAYFVPAATKKPSRISRGLFREFGICQFSLENKNSFGFSGFSIIGDSSELDVDHSLVLDTSKVS